MKMKNLVLIIIWCAITLPGILIANDFTYNGFTYRIIDNNSVELLGGSVTTETLIIPTSVEHLEQTYRITSIGKYAFKGNRHVTEIVFPESLKSIGEESFAECQSLVEIVFPDSLRKIDEDAFEYCENLSILHFGSFIELIDYDAFEECNLRLISINSDNPVVGSSMVGIADFPGLLLLVKEGNKDKFHAQWVIENRGMIIIENLVAGKLAQTIVNNGHTDFDVISSLRIYGEINHFDLLQLKNNFSSLINLDLSDVRIIENEIPSDLFKQKLLVSLKLPKTLKYIGSSAFQNCYYLRHLSNLPLDLEKIGNYAFQNCDFICDSLSFPSSMLEIGDYAFAQCSNLTGSLLIPDSVKYIGKSAFVQCSGLTGELKLPNKLFKIENGTFSGCSGISGNLELPQNLLQIGVSAFESCSNISGEILFPLTLNKIDSRAFKGCASLSGSLTFPDDLETIGHQAFSGCIGLSGSLIFPNTVNQIGDGAFEGCKGFDGNLSLPTSIRVIGNGVFNGCENLSGSLIIPPSINSISQYAFNDCKGIQGQVLFPPSVTSIGQYAFNNCVEIDSLVFSNAISSIHEMAFGNCVGVKRITISNNTPPVTHVNSFKGMSIEQCEVVVPKGRMLDYMKSDAWSSFVFFKEVDFVKRFRLTLSIEGNGLVQIDSVYASNGAVFEIAENHEAFLEIIPALGWEVSEVILEGKEVTSKLNDGRLKLPILTSESLLKVVLKKKVLRVNFRITEGGQVFLNKDLLQVNDFVDVLYGESLQLIIINDRDFKLNKILVDDTEITEIFKNGKALISNVISNLNLSISFRKLPSISIVGENKSIPIDHDLVLSVKIDDLSAQDSLISFQFDLNYDSLIVKFQGIETNNTLTAGGIMLVSSAIKSKLKLAYMNSTPIKDAGVLLNIRFTAKEIGHFLPQIENAIFNRDTIFNVFSDTISTFTKFGDVDGDDIVVAYDAALNLQYSVGIDPIPSKDPLPWVHWRQVAADVDGNDTINAYDAGLILQHSIDIIEQFPIEAEKKGAQLIPSNNGVEDITIEKEWDQLVFRSYGGVIGFNLDVENGFEFLSEPTSLSTDFIVAKNINQDHYKVGMATSSKISDNSILMVVPIITDVPEDVTFKLLINTRPKTVTMRIATGIDEHVLGHVVLIPNPVKDYFSIKGVDNGVLKIYDLKGRLLIDKEIINTNKVDVQFIENGVYFYRINTDQGVKTGKFIKL